MFSLLQYLSYVEPVNRIHRNDVAVEKAQVLAREHGIQASAYKVDGKRTVGAPCTQRRCQNAKLKSAVSESIQVSETITKVVTDFGKIDVFIANAG